MDFPTTHWSHIAKASLNGDSLAHTAMAEFLSRYRAPVVSLLTKKGILQSRVDDLAHDFFLQLMTRSSLRRADREKGSFRAFLKGALAHFLADDCDKNQTQRRGGGQLSLSLDAQPSLATELADPQSDTALLLDREWARNIIQRAVQQVEEKWQHHQSKADRFAVLRLFLPGASATPEQTVAADQLGLTQTAFRSELSRLRSDFRQAIRTEVAATVPSPNDTEEEIRYLFAVLQATQDTKLN